MSACTDQALTLHAFVDGELDAVNVLAFERHLDVCDGCRDEIARLRVLRARLAEPATRFTAPADLRARVRAALAAADPAADQAALDPPQQAPQANRTVYDPLPGGPVAASVDRPATSAGRAASVESSPERAQSVVRPIRSVRRWSLVGGLGSLAAAAALVAVLYVPSAHVEDQLVASHVRSLLADHLLDVATSDRHVVKPWFNGKIDFAPPVVELAPDGFPLAGGRLDYIDGRVVAALVYHRRQHVINVFAWPASGSQTGLPSATTAHADGYTLMRWTSGGLQFWAVSDVDAAELARFRDAFEQRAATPTSESAPATNGGSQGRANESPVGRG
jgi:anti-sigma factor RsiW